MMHPALMSSAPGGGNNGLVWCDSFQHYTDAQRDQKAYTNAYMGDSGAAYARIAGSYGMNWHSTVATGQKIVAWSETGLEKVVYAGLAFNWVSGTDRAADPDNDTLLWVQEYETYIPTISVVLTGDFRLAVKNAWQGTVLGTSDKAVHANSWHHVQARFQIILGFNPITGLRDNAYDQILSTVYLDSELAVDVSGYSPTPMDNQVPGVPFEGRVVHLGFGARGIGFGHGMYMADPWIATGGLLGDVKIVPLWPSGNGFHQDWAGERNGSLVGDDHYTLVDETTPDVNDELHTETIGAAETENFSDLSGMIPKTCEGIQMLAYGSLELSEDGRKVKHLLRVGGSTYDEPRVWWWRGGNYERVCTDVIPGSFAQFDEGAINGMEYGAKMVSES